VSHTWWHMLRGQRTTFSLFFSLFLCHPSFLLSRHHTRRTSQCGLHHAPKLCMCVYRRFHFPNSRGRRPLGLPVSNRSIKFLGPKQGTAFWASFPKPVNPFVAGKSVRTSQGSPPSLCAACPTGDNYYRALIRALPLASPFARKLAPSVTYQATTEELVVHLRLRLPL
jgi:hypothetical protein